MLDAILMTEWNIQSRAHGCQACGKPFADQEAYHTLLFDEQAELRRSDICTTCWEKQYREARDRKGFVSYWQGVYEAPPPPAEVVRKETAETLLRKLIELQDPRFIPAGYILAVMLERKRLLKVKDQVVRDGQRVFVYEQPKTGDLFTITDPHLRLDQLEQVQREVASLLEHGLDTTARTPGADAVATAQPGKTGSGGPTDSPAHPEAAVESRAD